MKRSNTKILIIAAALTGLAAGALVYYQNAAPGTDASSDASTTIDIGGQRFVRWDSPRKLQAISFQDEDGKRLSLADFHGRVVLLNLWATWCLPCRKEMPSLDRLNARRSGPAFEVVALSIDNDPALVKPFFREIGIKTLRAYFDPSARASTVLGAFAVPTTLLIGHDGREIGRALGEAEWDSMEVEALIDQALALPASKD
jgi:thiol-disulfide isomerase/thioredoxin